LTLLERVGDVGLAARAQAPIVRQCRRAVGTLRIATVTNGAVRTELWRLFYGSVRRDGRSRTRRSVRLGNSKGNMHGEEDSKHDR
jgi:hypothetical protein